MRHQLHIVKRLTTLLVGWCLCLAFLLPRTSPVVAQVCTGDCNGDGNVTIDELVVGLNIALETSGLELCVGFDRSFSGQVEIDELIRAVTDAQFGCGITPPTRSPTPTATSTGTPSLSRCGNGTLDAFEDCEDGNTFGGDGCAENCTDETSLPIQFDGVGELKFTIDSFGPDALGFAIPIIGTGTLIVGRAGADGNIPFVVREGGMVIRPIPVSPYCGCLMLLTPADRRAAEDCRSDPPFGPGNIMRGVIGCGPQGIRVENYTVIGLAQGVNVREGTSGIGPPGSLRAEACAGVGAFASFPCSVEPGNPDKGADGVPCTTDDNIELEAGRIEITTGSVRAEIPNPTLGGFPLETSTFFGQPLDCDRVESGGDLSGSLDFAAPRVQSALVEQLNPGSMGDALIAIPFNLLNPVEGSNDECISDAECGSGRVCECCFPSVRQCLPLGVTCVPGDCGTSVSCSAEQDLGSLLPVSITGTTVGRPNQLFGSCGGAAAGEVLYRWTPPSAGNYTIDTLGSAFDTVLHVRNASCAGTELACNDDFIDLTSEVEVTLSEGQSIVIVVDGFGGGGNYMLHIAAR